MDEGSDPESNNQSDAGTQFLSQPPYDPADAVENDLDSASYLDFLILVPPSQAPKSCSDLLAPCCYVTRDLFVYGRGMHSRVHRIGLNELTRCKGCPKVCLEHLKPKIRGKCETPLPISASCQHLSSYGGRLCMAPELRPAGPSMIPFPILLTSPCA